jgi:imidazolonepropionase-like amidohydrolase
VSRTTDHKKTLAHPLTKERVCVKKTEREREEQHRVQKEREKETVEFQGSPEFDAAYGFGVSRKRMRKAVIGVFLKLQKRKTERKTV